MISGTAKHYTIYDSNTDTWYDDVFSLASFCREHNLNESCMRDVSTKRQSYQHRGFFCKQKDSDYDLVDVINAYRSKTLISRFNKIKRPPVDKKKRYNQTDLWIAFQQNVEKQYQELHVKQKLSCNEIGVKIGADPETIRCLLKRENLPRLNHPKTHSCEEREVIDFLNTYENSFSSSRQIIYPLELDAYSDVLKLGVEYCGLFWHSERYRNSREHLNKLKACNSKNIRLITIFSDEWKNRNFQVKSFLKSVLRANTVRINARSCMFSRLNSDVSKAFFERYHIQGAPHSARNSFGLIYNSELVGAISFEKHHRNSQDTVLSRLVFKDDVSCRGGASKLFKNAVEQLNLEKVVSWSDNRWSDGNVYEKLNFCLDKELPPDYSYVFGQHTHRISKQSMKKKDIGCPSDMTEHEFCLQNGYYRIYDCGKKCWIWNKH